MHKIPNDFLVSKIKRRKSKWARRTEREKRIVQLAILSLSIVKILEAGSASFYVRVSSSFTLLALEKKTSSMLMLNLVLLLSLRAADCCRWEWSHWRPRRTIQRNKIIENAFVQPSWWLCNNDVVPVFVLLNPTCTYLHRTRIMKFGTFLCLLSFELGANGVHSIVHPPPEWNLPIVLETRGRYTFYSRTLCIYTCEMINFNYSREIRVGRCECSLLSRKIMKI